MRYLILIFICTLTWGVSNAQETYQLSHDGYERRYELFIGEDVSPDRPASLMIALHGAGSGGVEFEFFGGFDQHARESNTIIAYPSGLELGWNYLNAHQLAQGELYTRDWDFMWAMIDDIRQQYTLDDQRITVVGYSNGGMLALRMMCDYGDRLAGVAVIGANFNDTLARYCLDMTPTSFMLVLGMRDHIFPWDGYTDIKFDGRFIIGFSVIQTLNLMMNLNDCSFTSDAGRISTANSPFVVARDLYTDCMNHTQIGLYGIVDHTHAYPFAPKVILDDGRESDIAGAVWAFLATQTLEGREE